MSKLHSGGFSFELAPSAQAAQDVFAAEVRNSSLPIAMSKAAARFEESGNAFFVAALVSGEMAGVYSLPCNDSGKYPAAHDTVKGLLAHCGAKGSARDYCGRVLRAAWQAAQLHPGMSLPVGSFRDLVKLAQPVKEITSQGETAAAEVVTAQAAAVAAAVAEQAAAEQARQAAEQAAAEQAEKYQAAVAVERDEVARLRALVEKLQNQLDAQGVELAALRIEAAAKPAKAKTGTK